MSIGLYVELSGPLEVEHLIEDTCHVFYQMTTLDIAPRAKIYQLDEGAYSTPVQLYLTNSSSPAVELRANELGRVQIYIFTDDDEPLLISVDPVGEEKYRGAKVLAAASAIAIAQRHKSGIQNHQNSWGSTSYYSPKGLLDFLRCRHSHENMEEAVLEVLTNIEAA